MAAKLKPINFKHEAKNGERFEINAEVTVGQDGEFAVTIPDELEDAAKQVSLNWNAHTRVKVQRPRTHLKVISVELSAATTFIDSVIRAHLTCETVTERVILYSVDNSVSYIKDALDGQIYVNGRHPPEGAYKSGRATWHGRLNGASSRSTHYRIGLAACVRDRITYRRSSGEKVVYEHVPDRGSFAPGVDLLNGFIGLDIKPYAMKSMPYTEEAARFFHDTMLGMLKLADRMESFFGDDTAVMHAIASGGGSRMLLDGPSASDEASPSEARGIAELEAGDFHDFDEVITEARRIVAEDADQDRDAGRR